MEQETSMKNPLETTFAGLTLSNPIIIGSSGLTNTAKKNLELEQAGAGAVVLKSLFEEQLSQESFSLLSHGIHTEEMDYVTNYFKENEVRKYLNLIKESKTACSIPIIASINCYTDNSWEDFAQQIEAAGADALELNLFFLNTEKTKKSAEMVEDKYLEIVRKISRSVRIPVVAKISKYFSNLVVFINELKQAGASGVVLFNRYYQPDINIHSLQVTSGQLFSSNYDIGDTLRWTSIVSGNNSDVSIASSSGIHDFEDVVKCILSGASAVEVCSTIYQNGNSIISKMNHSIKEWMSVMNFDSIGDFKGKFNKTYSDDPSLFERFQFMKYFSNRD